MATKSRLAAAKKAWATRRKLYGKSGVSKSTVKQGKMKKARSKGMTRAMREKVADIKRKMPIHGTQSQMLAKFKKAGLNAKQAKKELNKFNSWYLK